RDAEKHEAVGARCRHPRAHAGLRTGRERACIPGDWAFTPGRDLDESIGEGLQEYAEWVPHELAGNWPDIHPTGGFRVNVRVQEMGVEEARLVAVQGLRGARVRGVEVDHGLGNNGPGEGRRRIEAHEVLTRTETVRESRVEAGFVAVVHAVSVEV